MVNNYILAPDTAICYNSDMKIRHMDESFEVKNVKFSLNATTIYVDARFYQGKKCFHIVNQLIEEDYFSNNPNSDAFVFYRLLRFRVDKPNLNSEELAKVLVNFLGHYKLYIHNYRIIQDRTFVAYELVYPGENKFLGLDYRPLNHEHCIFIEADVQLEDGVDYDELFNIKIRRPVKKISWSKLKELGYDVDKFEENTDRFFENITILSDGDARKLLRQL